MTAEETYIVRIGDTVKANEHYYEKGTNKLLIRRGDECIVAGAPIAVDPTASKEEKKMHDQCEVWSERYKGTVWVDIKDFDLV